MQINRTQRRMLPLYVMDAFILAAAADAISLPMPRRLATVAFSMTLLLHLVVIRLLKIYAFDDRPSLFYTLLILSNLSAITGIFLFVG